MMDFAQLLFMLAAAHALADYPLQGPFLSEAKNRNTAIGKVFWPHALFAHAMIHGGLVFMLTMNFWLGLAEAIVHAGLDWLKCEDRISLNLDQGMHLFCKVLWAAIALWGAA